MALCTRKVRRAMPHEAAQDAVSILSDMFNIR
jgi:hypothetical protein